MTIEQKPPEVKRPGFDGTPIRVSMVSEDRMALERAKVQHRHIHWTEIKRAAYGNAWSLTGTLFL